MICPVEIITSFFAKIGFKKKRPNWLLSGWAITVFYAIILLVGIQVFAIHRNPFHMAFYLLIIVSVSVIIGIIYEKNSFCRYVCPVGYLLGMYSKLSFYGWRVKNVKTCERCKDKSCIHKDYQNNLNYKSCGIDLYPANIEDNTDCILCAGCMKTCSKYMSSDSFDRPNPELTYIGFANDLFKLKPLRMPEIAFIFVVSGFVISEILSEWNVTDSVLQIFPKIIDSTLSINSPVLEGLIYGIITFLVLPFVIWIIPFFVSKMAGSALKMKNYFLMYGIAFIPIIAAAHIDKAILKTTSRLPYFQNVFSDTRGMETAQKIIDGKITLHPNPLWVNMMVSVLLTLMMFGGVMLSIVVVRLVNRKMNNVPSNTTLYLIPAIYGSLFLVMIVTWRWFY
jgi:hypothetical protein